MCAISGIVNTHADARALHCVELMNDVQQHRGPDDAGTFVCDDAVFGHRRLSIIDLAGGHQPMVTDNGRLMLVCNGEIYNFRELREELSNLGHKFQTNCDSEVILHLYELYGTECVSHLDGMFAFALFDMQKRRLLMARDRLGQKPLLYFMHGNSLIFASEFSGLAAHPAFPSALDKIALSDYLSLQYIPAPDSAFLQVRKLPPGHILTYDLATDQMSIFCYWQPDYSIKNSDLSFNAATSELRRLVEKAVEKRLVSDVPIGTFLSGGVDSCIVTGLAAKLLYPAPCDTFTAGFGVAAYDERAAAAQSAKVINQVVGGNLRCHEREIDPKDFSIVEILSQRFGEPFADASAIPMYLLSKFAKEKISVALSGDGADEIFAGYERYLAMRYAERISILPLPLRKVIFKTLTAMLPDHGERSTSGRLRRIFKLFSAPLKNGYFGLLDRCPAQIKNELFGSRMDEAVGHDSSISLTGLDWELIARDQVEQLGELDLKTYLPGDILVKADIASMANALELRSPFMDKEVVEFAARLPMKYKLSGKERKYILKQAFPEFVTPELSARPKRGFGVPVASWLRDEWKEESYHLLFNTPLTSSGYIEAGALHKYWDWHQSKRYDFSYLLWGLMIFALFLKRFNR